MKVVMGFPPNYAEIVRVLGRPPWGAVFTWGDTVYSPSGAVLDPALIVHETTHCRQQVAVGPEAWWQRYLIDRRFRVQQEVEAYRAQYGAACRLNQNKSARRNIVRLLADHLSSPMYGRILNRKQAQEAIEG